MQLSKFYLQTHNLYVYIETGIDQPIPEAITRLVYKKDYTIYLIIHIKRQALTRRMAMRPRGGAAAGTPRRGGARTGGVRPVYEDFKPSSEWQQDDESHILNINLPGFMKEQIRVSTEGRNTIRVRGERLVAGNKWSRFEEDFQVPENGEMNSVRAKFGGGILNISVPKKNVKPQVALPPNQPKSTAVQKQAKPQNGQDKVLPEASTSQPKDGRILEPKKTSGDQKQSTVQNVHDSQAIDNRQSTKEKSLEQKTLGDQKQPTPQKGRGKDFQAVGNSRVTNEERLEPRKESAQRERSTTPLSTLVSPNDEKNDQESKGKHVAAEVKKAPGIEMAKVTKRRKDGTIGLPEKKEDYNELGAFTKEKYKKAVKGLTELNEERQLLVNMGVAMLVIVSLTAYITYKFASGKDKN